jgi:hypothetical protein
VVAYAAGSPSPTPIPSGGTGAAICKDYTSHLASDLGVDSSKLASASQSATSQALSDAVSNGLLTQKRADAIKARLSKVQGCQIRLPQGQAAARSGAVVDAAAKALGIDATTLRDDLVGGQSISQIAGSGTTEAQFAASFQSDLKMELDASVKAGKLNQDTENKILTKAPSLANRLWTSGLSKAKATS